MTVTPATSAYEIVLAVHVMAVVVAFGAVFAYPIMFALAARRDPRSLPLMHRVEYTIERWVVNPGLLVVVLAGVYLASDGHQWSEFFVQWGLAVAVVLGAVVGSIMIPAARRAEALAAADVTAAAGATVAFGDEYQALARRLSRVGSLLDVLVLVTILFMVIKP